MLSGSCLCGGVRYEIDGDLPPIQLCFCTQCRKAQGGAFAANVPIAAEALRLTAGSQWLRSYESSPGKQRVFCGRCGSPLYSRRDAQPGTLRLRVGLIDQPLDVRPAVQFHTASRCNWFEPDPALPQYPGALPAR